MPDLELPLPELKPTPRKKQGSLASDLADFCEFGEVTKVLFTDTGNGGQVPTFVNEFWTARQRQANSLHEISYRACFKPQLPRFFIERLTEPGEAVYDPFMGRGTTPVEAALMGRVPLGTDISPVCHVMTRPRLAPPEMQELEARCRSIPLAYAGEIPEDLLVFYHEETLRAICALKKYFADRRTSAQLDSLDEWIEMVALNRLTGHSPGFFSVYTLPPNQAVSVQSQKRINEKRKQVPPRRDVIKIILKKSRQLLGDVDSQHRAALQKAREGSRFLCGRAGETAQIPGNSVALAVTSPPFLNVVQYEIDNWLRCWFLGIDPKSVQLTMARTVEQWTDAMWPVFQELHRVIRPGGHLAFEVGEIHKGETRLEEHVLPLGERAGLKPLLVLINDQEFTKTANCWGISNMDKGTNTNRVVVFRKPA